MNEKLIPIREVAARMGIAQSTVRTYMQKGFLIPICRSTLPGRPSLFRESDVDEIMQSSIFIKPSEQTRRGTSAYRQKIERKTEDEIHSSGAIIHWSEFYRDEKSMAWVPITCAACGAKFNKREGGMKSASKKHQFTGCCTNCYGQNRRPKKMLSNGILIRPDGYVYRHIRTFSSSDLEIISAMRLNNGIYVPEHRAIVAIHIGRPLLDTESVHHIDGNKQNNDIDNLLLYDRNDHSKEHSAIFIKVLDQDQAIKNMQDEIDRLRAELESVRRH